MDQTDRQTDKNLDTSSQSFCIAEFPKSSFPISSARSMVPWELPRERLAGALGPRVTQETSLEKQ